MCLSTVYRNAKKDENIVMRNVMSITCEEDTVILTDLMERTVAVQGKLLAANLVDGFVIIQET